MLIMKLYNLKEIQDNIWHQIQKCKSEADMFDHTCSFLFALSVQDIYTIEVKCWLVSAEGSDLLLAANSQVKIKYT